MTIELDEISKPVFAALEAAGLSVTAASRGDELADAELEFGDKSSVQVGFDSDGAYFIFSVWTDDRTLHSGVLRQDPAEIVADVRAWRATGELRGPG